jgi:hypothetical protein
MLLKKPKINKCIYCHKEIKKLDRNNQSCEGFCRFVINYFCINRPDGDLEVTKSIGEIKIRFWERVSKNIQRRLGEIHKKLLGERNLRVYKKQKKKSRKDTKK